MKRIYNRDHRLESHPLFPYIAWTTVFLFAGFVLHLVGQVEAHMTELEKRSTSLSQSYERSP